MSAAYEAADNHLLGRAPKPMAQAVAEIESVTTGEVADAIDQALARMLWTVPFSSPENDRRFEDLPRWSESAVQGTEYQLGSDADTSRIDDRLIVGPDGASALFGGRPITVLWSQIRAAQRFRDRSWTLHGADGFTLTVRARDWYRGSDAVADIELLVPRAAVVDMAEDLSPGQADTDPAGPLLPGPSVAAWQRASDAHLGGPPPPQALAGSPPPPQTTAGPTSGGTDTSVWGAVAIVWVFAGAISLWLLSTIGDGSGSRAKLRLAGLVLVGAAFATRTLLKR